MEVERRERAGGFERDREEEDEHLFGFSFVLF